MPGTIYVVEQAASCGPGRIGGVFARQGVKWELCRAHAGQPLPPVEQVAGLVLLGGPMSANDELPYLTAELHLIEHAVKAGVPVLGICLGAQLTAKALGARVYRNSEPEVGWWPVWTTGPAAGDPVMGGLGAGATVFHWHGETVDLPRGAERLAYSDRCAVQAFRLGDNVHGMQFHPEVDATIIRDWIVADEACGTAREARHPIDAESHAHEAATVAETLFVGWLTLIA